MPQRVLWLLIGFLATGAGIAGIVLPLVPTTPFLLVAAFAFARSSDRLHTWLVTHPRLGPPITHWRKHGAISRRAKTLAIVVMAATLAGGWWAGLDTWLLALQTIVMAGAATFILSRPDGPQ